MATIVQDYGPIYGEVVNGTVQGRPNGSIYVPISNKVAVVISRTHIKDYSSNQVRMCNSSGTSEAGFGFVAESQDLASNVVVAIYSDSDCTEMIAYNPRPAGIFNQGFATIGNRTESIVNGSSYYIRAQLMNNGTPVATSEVLEVTGWASE